MESKYHVQSIELKAQIFALERKIKEMGESDAQKVEQADSEQVDKLRVEVSKLQSELVESKELGSKVDTLTKELQESKLLIDEKSKKITALESSLQNDQSSSSNKGQDSENLEKIKALQQEIKLLNQENEKLVQQEKSENLVIQSPRSIGRKGSTARMSPSKGASPKGTPSKAADSQQLAELEKMNKELKEKNENLNKEIELMEEKIDDMQKDMDEIKDDAEDKDDQIGFLKQDLETAKREAANFKKSMTMDSRKDLGMIKLQEEYKQLEKKVESLTTMQQSFSFEKRQLLIKIEELEDQIKEGVNV